MGYSTSSLLLAVGSLGWLGSSPALLAQATPRDSTPPPSANAKPLVALASGRARARVTASSGRRIVGRVVSADDTLLVLQPERRPIELWARPRAVYDRRQLTRLELSEHPERRLQTTVLGALIGAAVGAAIGAAHYSDPCASGRQIVCRGRSYDTTVGSLVGMSAGALLGRFVFGRDQWRGGGASGAAADGGRLLTCCLPRSRSNVRCSCNLIATHRGVRKKLESSRSGIRNPWRR